MRLNLKPIYFIYILFFGLLSCSSDKSEVKTQDTDKKKVHNFQIFLKAQNEKLLEIKESMESVRIDDQFVDFHGNNNDYKTESYSECTTEYLDSIYSNSTTQQGTTLTIRNILPLEVFEPTESDYTKVSCNINITYVHKETNQEHAKVMVTVFINDIQEDSNYNLPIVEGSNHPIHLRAEFQGEYDLPEPNLEFQTLCNGDLKRTYPKEQKVFYQDLFDNSMFEKHHLKSCRFVMRNMKTNKTYVTKVFKIQKSPGKVEVVWNSNLTGETKNNYINQSMALLTVTNTSTSPTQILIENFPDKVRVMPVYAQSPRNYGLRYIAWHNLDIPARWVVLEGAALNQSRSPGHFEMKLGVNESITLSLELGYSLNCAEFKPKPPQSIGQDTTLKLPNCQRYLPLAGLLYAITPPSIFANQFIEPLKGYWKAVTPGNIHNFPPQPLNLPRLVRYNQGAFNIMAPNRDYLSTCDVTSPLPVHDFYPNFDGSSLTRSHNCTLQ